MQPMTPRANSLTGGDTRASSARSPTMSAADTRGFMDALQRLGYDVASLLKSVGLGPADLQDPDRRISCDAFGAVIAQAQQHRFTPNLALELACVTPIGAWPLLDYLVVTSETVWDGIRQLARYFRLVGSLVALRLWEETEAVRVEVVGPGPFAAEYDTALVVLHMRNETDGRFGAASVCFRHAPDDPAAFERTLGCAVDSHAAWDGLTVRHETWRLPLRRRDPVLRGMLESQANETLARLPEREGLALEVQRALTARVAGGDTRIETVARQLAMSPRTLQRRLADEGVSFQRLLIEARKEAAARYISDSPLAIGEVAYLVGYSEPAPFHRAFKRWYGMTPEAFRQKRRAARHLS